MSLLFFSPGLLSFLKWVSLTVASGNGSLPFKVQVAVNGMWKDCQHAWGVGSRDASGSLAEQVGMSFALRSSGRLGAQEVQERGMRAWVIHPVFGWRQKKDSCETLEHSSSGAESKPFSSVSPKSRRPSGEESQGSSFCLCPFSHLKPSEPDSYTQFTFRQHYLSMRKCSLFMFFLNEFEYNLIIFFNLGLQAAAISKVILGF